MPNGNACKAVLLLYRLKKVKDFNRADCALYLEGLLHKGFKKGLRKGLLKTTWVDLLIVISIIERTITNTSTDNTCIRSVR